MRMFSGTISSSKALSMSAPGAINVEHNTVKFDDEIKKARHSITTQCGIKVTLTLNLRIQAFAYYQT